MSTPAPRLLADELNQLQRDIHSARQQIALARHALEGTPNPQAETELGLWVDLLEETQRELKQRLHTFAPRPPLMVHAYPLPQQWAGREQEQTNVLQALSENRTRVISITALGGMGKSALTRQIFAKIEQRAIFLDGALWFSFYVTASFDTFLQAACIYLLPGFDPQTAASPYTKLDRLFEILPHTRCLFVLDGIEMLQEANPNSALYGRFHAPEAREFFNRFVKQSAAQVVVTSRWELADLDALPEVERVSLSGLRPEAARQYLLDYGVRGNPQRLAAACERLVYHPLALHLLADFLVRYRQGDLDSAQQLLNDLPEGEPGLAVQTILKAWWSVLTPPQRRLMTFLSAWRGAVTRAVARELLQHWLPAEQAEELLLRVSDTALLRLDGEGDSAWLMMHALVKVFFYQRMGQEERQQTHLALRDFSQGLPLPQTPRTFDAIQPVVEACFHCIAAGMYQQGYEMLARRDIFAGLLRMAQYGEAFELVEALWQAAQAPAQVWQANSIQYAWLAHSYGIVLTLLGEPNLALKFFYRALDVLQTRSNWRNLFVNRLSLADVLLDLGQTEQTESVLQEARALLQVEPILQAEAYALLLREARLQAFMGNLAQALDTFQQAIERAVICDARAAAFALLYRADVHLAQGNTAVARKDLESAQKLIAAYNYADLQAMLLKRLGDAHTQAFSFVEAEAAYRKAAAHAQESGHVYLRIETLLGLAGCAQAVGEAVSVRQYATLALDLAESAGYGLLRAQARGFLGGAAPEG